LLFAGHVGLVVIPLMLFHQIQLMVCASLARHYAARRESASSNAACSSTDATEQNALMSSADQTISARSAS
jgi:hypothetical protein